MTTPTDAALSQLRHLYQNMVNGGVRDTASAKRIAEGLLSPAIAQLENAIDKWGQPQAVAGGEPVAWRSAVLDLIDDCPGLSLEQDRWLSRRVKELDFPSAPPPQAVREPLTEDQRSDIATAAAGFNWASDYVEAIDYVIDGVEQLHGITKGGQHGAE